MSGRYLRRPSLVEAVLVADLVERTPEGISKKGEWPDWLSNAHLAYPDGISVGYGGWNDLKAKSTDYLVRDAKGNIYKVPEAEFILEYDPYRSTQSSTSPSSKS